MKTRWDRYLLKTIFLLMFAIIISSCNDKVKFEEIDPKPKNHGIVGMEVVKSYTVRYNPKANSTIIIELSSGTKFKASRLNASQTAAILSIISMENLKFDRDNEEFVLSKFLK